MLFILRLRYLWGGATGNFRVSGVKRDIGKYVQDHMAGKLAERAFAKFSEERFHKPLTVDFTQFRDSRDFSRPDIVGVWEEGVQRDPKVKLELKDTKPSSRWILVPAGLASTIACDYFVVVCVDVALDQLLRYFKGALPPAIQQDHELMAAIPDFGEIVADIRGVIPKAGVQSMLKFAEGDPLPETDVFQEAKRLPKVRSPMDCHTLRVDFGPPVGPQDFAIAGECDVFTGTAGAGGDKVHLVARGPLVLTSPVMGRYELQPGSYRVNPGVSLPSLGEANYGIPLKAVKELSEEEWRAFIGAL